MLLACLSCCSKKDENIILGVKIRENYLTNLFVDKDLSFNYVNYAMNINDGAKEYFYELFCSFETSDAERYVFRDYFKFKENSDFTTSIDKIYFLEANYYVDNGGKVGFKGGMSLAF